LFALCLIHAGPAGAADVDVPLIVPYSPVGERLASLLELDAQGHARLGADDCNRVDLSDLQLGPGTGGIEVSMAVTAASGARVLGRCRGPGAWQGRMNVILEPSVSADGRVVRFTARAAELVRPDGSRGLLTPATRILAENLVLPRIERLELDLAGPLSALDDLIASVFPDQPGVLERIRLVSVEAREAGLRANLRIEVAAVSAQEAEPALDAEELARWQRLEDEFDGFLTVVIAALAGQADDAGLRLEMLGVLLDARHSIAEALGEDPESDFDLQDDPVRRLFVESWDRLRPWLAELEGFRHPDIDGDLALAAFISGGDALRALDALGPEYALEINRDGLRRLARLLLAGDVPESFTPLPLTVDPALRSLFGLDRLPPATEPQPATEPGFIQGLADWLVPSALAAPESPAEALRGLVPRLAILDDYLELVASLLEQQTDEHLRAGSRLPDRLKPRFDPLVRATAWKESCWRQFIGPADNPRVITSSVGALGMMQISGRVWRGLYDIDRLAEEVDYNVAAGTEILEHYLVDYAIRRGEHEHPGGDDNLIKATYAAYNGGPGHLSRYRRDDTAPRLRAIDNEFWRHYTTIKAEQWPDISSCYAVGG
ncbi:MAG: transglycosylase SLT domain-containing protein, partial [Wenzhouxiangellaceae bacterium]